MSAAGGSAQGAVGPVVSVLADANARSLLERSADEWIALLPPANKTTAAGAVGFLRYATRRIETVADGAGIEAEYRRDVWDARRLGLAVTVGHYRVSFGRIAPRHVNSVTTGSEPLSP